MDENDLFLKVFARGLSVFGLFMIITMPIIVNKMKYAGTSLGLGVMLAVLPFGFVVSALVANLMVLNTFGGEASWIIYLLVVSSIVGAFTFCQEYLRYLFK